MVDESELIHGTKVPSVVLRGAEEEAHIDLLVRSLRGARLNAHFPDVRAMISHLQVLSPKVHQGVYDGLEVDVRTGLPTYKEWTRAQTDVRLAANQLKQFSSRAELAKRAEGHQDGPHVRQLKRYDYYNAIQNSQLVPLGEMHVKLRRVDPQTSTAHFHVVLDKLDASGVFVRYAIDVAQRRDSVETIATVDPGDMANHTRDFQALIYQFTSLDSEFTFIKLASMAGLVVERVIKGVVGPVFTPQTQIPSGWESAANPFLATFSQDMAAIDVLEYKNNDPLEDVLAAKQETTGQAYAKMRESLGYQVFKDRKFVVERVALNDLRKFLQERGAMNIVYGV